MGTARHNVVVRHLDLYNKTLGRKLRNNERKKKASVDSRQPSRRSSRQRSSPTNEDYLQQYENMLSTVNRGVEEAADAPDGRAAVTVDEGDDTEMRVTIRK